MSQRGRKKGAVGEQSRALLLAIAADEFAEHGYHDAKISAIVAKAGLTQPAFYLYFQNKEAIFQELVGTFRTRLYELTQKSRLETGMEASAVSERITGGLTMIFRFLSENPSLTRIGFYLSEEAEAMKKQVTSILHENLVFEQEAGYFARHLDMQMVAESLVGVTERLTTTQLLPGRKSPEALASEVVQLFLDGMRSATEKPGD
ncbi:TetR/AcrR family transcriptional regulator [Brevibacillus ruminantium]|uniref:TetR/AcrR family transcriptional regulator n=1 Tax=Brevibacillus ruminantium TaxID=2950604 RepID=A0ABY4WG66_9BACL|nr:TetR/AcrR family transcriptional regulator [Brevibacillus ruminantium]USG65012.1 TetR/AcrR family transcriptional regulator [Brevibacillus ruminantium]